MGTFLIPTVADALEGKAERKENPSGTSIRRGNRSIRVNEFRSEHWPGQAGSDKRQATGPTRTESMTAAPIDSGSGTRGKMKRGKRRSSAKRVSSIKQNLVAFFSKRKNSHYMDQNQWADGGGGMASRTFSSYTVRPCAPETGSAPVASMETPNNRYHAFPIGSGRSSSRKGQNWHQTTGFNGRTDRVDGLARNEWTQKPRVHNYCRGKKKAPHWAHGNNLDVVEV